MNDLKEWARRMRPAWAKDAENLLDSLTTPGTVVSMLFMLGQQWERRQYGHWMFRIGDRVLVKQFRRDLLVSKALRDARPGQTVGDVIGNYPSYEGTVESIPAHRGGALVRHDSGELLGWMWHEIEHTDTAP